MEFILPCGSLRSEVLHLIVVTWTRVFCLICTPESRGPQAQGMRVYIYIRLQIERPLAVMRFLFHQVPVSLDAMKISKGITVTFNINV